MTVAYVARVSPVSDFEVVLNTVCNFVATVNKHRFCFEPISTFVYIWPIN